MPMRLRAASEAIPVVGFIATQVPQGGGLPEGIAGPAGLVLLGAYTTVYVAKTIVEMRRNGNGNNNRQNGAVLAAAIGHIEKALSDIAIKLEALHVRVDAHGDRLTRGEAASESHARELQRIRKEGCQQLQRHMDVLRNIDSPKE